MSQTKAQLLDGKSATIQFTGGSASAPSVTFTGDTNTGIYSPGADQVAISTNGVGRLLVDADGRLCVGGASTLGTVVVSTAGGAPVNLGVFRETVNGADFRISSPATASQYISGSALGDTVLRAAANNLIIGVSDATKNITFGTPSSERMRLDSSGRLGVGTSSPSTSLDVRGIISLGSSSLANAVIQKSAVPGGSFNLTITSGGGLTSESATTPTDALAGSVIKLLGGDPTTDTFGGGIQYYANGSTSPNGAGVGNQHVFYTRSAANTYTERLRIDASGRVGIGTTSPARPLDVNGSVRLSSGSVIEFGGTVTNFITGDNSSNYLAFGTNSSERLRIDSSGRVGIGTSSPGATLDVRGNATFTGNATARQTADFTNTGGQLYVGVESSAGGAVFTSSSAYAGIVGTNNSTSLQFATNGAIRATLDTSGRLGIGTTSPQAALTVGGSSRFEFNNTNNYIDAYTSNYYIYSLRNDGNNLVIESAFAGNIIFKTDSDGTGSSPGSAPERARIDGSGRLLVGTSSAVGGYSLQIEQNAGSAPFDGSIFLRRGISNASILADYNIGTIAGGSNTNVGGLIQFVSDAAWGTNDYPTRLVFSTTADGESSPTERMRITNDGYFKFTNSGSYRGATSTYNEIVQGSNLNNLFIRCSHASFTSTNLLLDTVRAANSAYFFLYAASSDSADAEFILRGDGQAYADGSWNGGGADYAEYFEWSDSNPDKEDRRGISVVLDGDKIREAVAGEDPIGVISGNPSVVGDSAWNKWSGKYLRDEFGTYIQEDYEVTDDDGNTIVQQRRKLNPAYDPDVEYISREERPEWACVGLMGKLRIRKGQITGSRWIKMRDINDSVEEWLVR